MLKPISDTQFRVNWKPDLPDVVMKNEKFGAIIHVVMCDGETPLYDSPLWLERTGAIGVPVDQEGRLVLLRNFRRALCDPLRLGNIHSLDLSNCGLSSLELPRGFPEADENPQSAALREVEEETGYPTQGTADFLGTTNGNTTFFPYSVHIYLVHVDTTSSSADVIEPNERIEEVVLLSWEDVLQKVARNEIICGMTKSALLSYAVWRQQKSVNE